MPSTQVFVCGATGTQGGVTARHLIAGGAKVHALTRDASSAKSQALEALGVKLFPGDYENAEALAAALAGCDGIYLNFLPSFKDLAQEARHASLVVAAARAAGVRHAAYASFMSHDELPKTEVFADIPLARPFFESKETVFRSMVDAGFDTWTRLQPGKFMGDFINPGVPMFPDLAGSGVWRSAIRAEDEIRLVDPDDIGITSAAALLHPEESNGQQVDIFSDILTPRSSQDKEPFLAAQLLTRYSGVDIPIETAKKWGSKCQSFEAFLAKNKDLVDSTFAGLPPA
ncbi:unnamed protein product [Parascedosporium putredinis]|uniref:NmrA-like domain-containing protein n=1 Tax=Parascedosporium putredinis TaxID=1442378 RepID=A0A9P1H2H6_9PEZI|nr:unnamed protein product [Parascedosporium putredinis]CAI7994825.1 unnamed protein product [Parascedosporium putredinis]